MASPPRTRNLRLEDVAEAETLVKNLNQALHPTARALDRGLTFEDNFRAQWHTSPVLYVPEDWRSASLQGAWVASSSTLAPKYRRADGEVELAGRCSGGASASHVLTLPSEYRPAVTHTQAVASGDAYGQVTIAADTGKVTADVVGAGGWFSLQGVRFLAADRAPLPVLQAPYDFTCEFKTAPKEVALVRVEPDTADGRAYFPAVTLNWTFMFVSGAPTIRILDVPGLVPGRRYVLTFRVVAA